MASPNFDSLSVQHSRNIADTVSAAANSGNKFTTAQRSNHLNNAMRRWLFTQTSLANYNALINYIADVTATTGSGTYSLSGVANIISVHCDSKVIKRGNERFFNQYQASATNGNSFLAPSATDPAYIYVGGVINLYPLTSFSSKTILIHYITTHTNLTAGFATDILVPSQYWHQILDLALVEAMNEIPSELSMARSKDKAQIIGAELQLLNEAIKES